VICFCIRHLNPDALAAHVLRSRRAVAVGQQQLNGAQLLIDIRIGILVCTRANAPQFLDEPVSLDLPARQFGNRRPPFGSASGVPRLAFPPSRHWLFLVFRQ
jgi:hypothetical protein